MVLKSEKFFHLSGRSFELDFLIGLEALLLVLSLKVGTYLKIATWERATRCLKGGSKVNAI